MEKYIVVRGDTLTAIAQRTHIPLKSLIAANRQIKDPNKILPGQFINLPIVVSHPIGTVGGPTLEDVFGWKSNYCSPLPVEGETFFLTFPFIEQALSQACAFRSPIVPNYARCEVLSAV